MKSRGPDRVLKKDVRGAADQWIKMVRNAQSESPQGALNQALLQWRSDPREPGEQQMLAGGAADLLELKVSAIQSQKPGSEASAKAAADETLALLGTDICSMHHLQSRQNELRPEEQQKATAIKLRPMLSELRRFLRLWFSEQLPCGAHTAPPPTAPV